MIDLSHGTKPVSLSELKVFTRPYSISQKIKGFLRRLSGGSPAKEKVRLLTCVIMSLRAAAQCRSGARTCRLEL